MPGEHSSGCITSLHVVVLVFPFSIPSGLYAIFCFQKTRDLPTIPGGESIPLLQRVVFQVVALVPLVIHG
jgi:hypothetical protein